MTDVAAKPKPHPGWSLGISYGPLLIFFLAYKFSNVFVGTAAFMAAIVAAVAVSKIKLGRVEPMLWLSAILVVGFGGLTIWLHDQRFIQIKPTIIYALLGVLLLIGLAMGKPLLRYVLEAGYDGLSEKGWRVMSLSWGLFFVAMAIINEVIRAVFDFDTWLLIKVWALPILSVIFAVATVPLLSKHGFGAEASGDKPAD